MENKEYKCDKCNGTYRNRNGVISKYPSNINGKYMELCEKCMFHLK